LTAKIVLKAIVSIVYVRIAMPGETSVRLNPKEFNRIYLNLHIWFILNLRVLHMKDNSQ